MPSYIFLLLLLALYPSERKKQQKQIVLPSIFIIIFMSTHLQTNKPTDAAGMFSAHGQGSNGGQGEGKDAVQGFKRKYKSKTEKTGEMRCSRSEMRRQKPTAVSEPGICAVATMSQQRRRTVSDKCLGGTRSTRESQRKRERD
jgi:hypothetical protein